MTAEPIPDRRLRRRQETIEEVVDVAAAVMAEQGVAGLSIGEVARRMGIRPPSLYVYFDSKNALYDALFARGAQLVLDDVRTKAGHIDPAKPVEETLLHTARTFVRWAVENPAYTQLLFWRPVPGYTPSAQAYAPAVELVETARERFAELQRLGLLRSDVPAAQMQRDWTVLTSGVISQQLANAPHESFAKGTFTSALPELVAMFVRHYAPPSRPRPTRRGRDGNSRRSDR